MRSDFSLKSPIVFIWLLTVPAGFWGLAVFRPVIRLDAGLLLAITLLTAATVYFPIVRRGVPLLLVGWLTLPVFLEYGLLAEAAVTQLALLATIPSALKKPEPIRRLAFNSFMFFCLSLLSAAAFHLAGGREGEESLLALILPAAVYIIVHSFGNSLFLHVHERLEGSREPLFSQGTLQDAMTLLFVYPYGLTLYFLQHFIGAWSLFILGVPFFFVTFMLRRYDASEKSNGVLTQAVKLSRDMAGKLTQPEVIRLFTRRLPEILPVDYLYLYDIRNGRYEPLRAMEKGAFTDPQKTGRMIDEAVAGMVHRSQEDSLFGRQKDWAEELRGYFPETAESLMGVRIMRNRKVEGILVILSDSQNAYEVYQHSVLELLGAYLAVALDKARYVQRTVDESIRCGLTGLYNYRFMEQQLAESMDRLNAGELRELSFVMLDIDHFKSINDRYGHDTGNEVLIGFARMLDEQAAEGWTVARYGGEEFAVILPDVEKGAAVRFAEKLRLRIERNGFSVPSGVPGETIRVSVTVSVGVSSAPDDGGDGMSLKRNADRALYTGAKQKGRNKVAAYSS